MDLTLSSAVIAVVTVLLAFIYNWVKSRSMVPGPTGLPYLGLYPFLTDENIYPQLEEYKMKYGNVFSFTYTGRLYVNLGSIKSMREALVNKSDCFTDKYQETNILTEMLRNGVTFVNGEPWKVLRKFFILKFKEYGLNTVRDNMAGPVYSSLDATIDDIKSLREKPINIIEFLGQRCAVTMRRIIFGETGVSDEELGKMILSYTESLEGNLGVNLLLIGPLARFLFKVKPSFRKNLNGHRRLARLVLESARKVESSMSEEHPGCIIEEFYAERNKRRRDNDATWEYFSDEALVESLLQFIGDGIQAVAGFIAGLLNTLLDFPDEQGKLYSEIMEVVGGNRQPTAEDKHNLPYTNAFINEFLRHTCFVNFFPSVQCTKETTIQGHRIPVGSITLLNFRMAHYDTDVFEDPTTFNPSRYMASDGKQKTESPVAFGLGKRSCSGEPFVMLQAFLFLTTIVKNFKIVASNAPRSSSVEDLLAGKLELRFVPRSENETTLLT